MPLTYHLLSTRYADETFTKFGTAAAIIVTLGLHRRRRTHGFESQIAPVDQEYRKRTYWAAFVLDRYLSAVGGRPRTLQDSDSDQELPAIVDDEDLTPAGTRARREPFDSVMDAPIAHIRLAQISGRGSAQIYPLEWVNHAERLSQSLRIRADLVSWKAQLPVFLGQVAASSLSPRFQRQSLILHLAHAHAVIHATRPFLLMFCKNSFKYPESSPDLTKAVHDCVSSAHVIVDTIEAADSCGALSLSWWFTQYVSFCAVAVIYIYTIIQHQITGSHPSSPDSYTPAPGSLQAESDERSYLATARRCQKRLTAAVKDHYCDKRYTIILEELQQEMTRHLTPLEVGDSGIVLVGDVSLRNAEETGENVDADPLGAGCGDMDWDFSNIIDDWSMQEWTHQSGEMGG